MYLNMSMLAALSELCIISINSQKNLEESWERGRFGKDGTKVYPVSNL